MKDEYDLSKFHRRGRVAKSIKVVKTFRLDPEVMLWLEEESRKQGMGYQTFLNWFLRKNIGVKTSVEDRLQRLEEKVFKKKR